MRKITAKSIDAFLAGQPFSSGNMSVQIRPWQQGTGDWVILQLHGNPIARYPVGRPGELQICDGNWQTVTTKDRLNALPGVSVHQKAGVWYLNGQEWDGEWTHVTDGYTIKQIGTVDLPEWRVYPPAKLGLCSLDFGTLIAARTYVAVQTGNVLRDVA